MTAVKGQRGFILVTVLIVTVVGLLFGAGALLLFRFQCQLRVDRQHELEKVYAVRSVLNYLRTYTAEIPSEGKSFRFHTANSDRDLKLTAKPVAAVFPDFNNPVHLDMSNEGGNRRVLADKPNSGYYPIYDYECGALDQTNGVVSLNGGVCNQDKDNRNGLSLANLTETNNVKWWVNIGMRQTGGWLQEDYGRRYYFQPLSHAVRDDVSATNDIMRLCLIREVTNETNEVGCRHGWPLTKDGERALVFQMCTQNGGSVTNNAEMTLLEYIHKGGTVTSKILMNWSNRPSLCHMGMQIANDKICLFYIGNEKVTGVATDEVDLSSRGYIFSDVVNMSVETHEYFSSEVWLGGKRYCGIITNSAGKVVAPEMRAVFEVERVPGRMPNKTSGNFLTRFRVTPAYQYDIFLEYPLGTEPQRATVAQKMGIYTRGSVSNWMVTYDTHGTENKGFRKDEREAERRRNGQ